MTPYPQPHPDDRRIMRQLALTIGLMAGFILCIIAGVVVLA